MRRSLTRPVIHRLAAIKPTPAERDRWLPDARWHGLSLPEYLRLIGMRTAASATIPELPANRFVVRLSGRQPRRCLGRILDLVRNAVPFFSAARPAHALAGASGATGSHGSSRVSATVIFFCRSRRCHITDVHCDRLRHDGHHLDRELWWDP